MTTPQLAETPVRSDLELTRRWVALLAPPIFGARALWLTWIGDDGVQLPLLLPIDDVPRRADPTMLPDLAELHAMVLTEQLGGRGHLAMALCRPGGARPDDDDHAWAEALGALFDDLPGSTWSLHLAAGGQVQALVEGGSW